MKSWRTSFSDALILSLTVSVGGAVLPENLPSGHNFLGVRCNPFHQFHRFLYIFHTLDQEVFGQFGDLMSQSLVTRSDNSGPDYHI
jgi:hypothetical protein